MADQLFPSSRRAAAFPPACVQANATQAATLAGCGATDWHCACNSYEFLAIVQPMIYQLCGANASEALSSAQQYCVGENPDLLKSRAQEFLPPVFIVTVLSILTVALRFHARRTSKTALGADDWLAVCALVCAVVFSLLQPVGLTWGEGRHLFMVTPNTQARSSKSTLASAWMIAISLICLKDSICALYLRIFGHVETFRLIIVITGVVVPVVQLLSVMLFTLSCHPIAFFWDKDILGGTCWNFQQVVVGLAAADLATGLWVLFLPVPILVGLHTTTSRKIALVLMFFMGGFACISAAMRIPFVLLIDIYDTSWSLVPFTIWSNIELHIGIISVCLPALRPLFGRWGRSFDLTEASKSNSGLDPANNGSQVKYRGKSKGGSGAWASAQKRNATDSQRILGSHISDEDMWPLSAIGVTKEVDVSADKVGGPNRAANSFV